jgi:hypothetical protein
LFALCLSPSVLSLGRWLIYYPEFQEFIQPRVQIEQQSKEGPLLQVE